MPLEESIQEILLVTLMNYSPIKPIKKNHFTKFSSESS